jgi:hypothetical protein
MLSKLFEHTVPEKRKGIEIRAARKFQIRIKTRTVSRSGRRQRDAGNRGGSSPFKVGPPALTGKPFFKICCLSLGQNQRSSEAPTRRGSTYLYLFSRKGQNTNVLKQKRDGKRK